MREKSSANFQKMCKRIMVSQKIQIAGNIRGMYDGTKKTIGSVQKKTESLKSSIGVILKEKTNQIDRWVKLYYCITFVNLVQDSICCPRSYIKCLLYVLTEEAV